MGAEQELGDVGADDLASLGSPDDKGCLAGHRPVSAGGGRPGTGGQWKWRAVNGFVTSCGARGSQI